MAAVAYPAITDQTREQLLTIAHQQGYDTDKLIWRQDDLATP